MEYVYTNGEDPAFAGLCHELDDFLNELAGGEKNRAEYLPYNRLDDIHDAIVAYDGERPVGCASIFPTRRPVRRAEKPSLLPPSLRAGLFLCCFANIIPLGDYKKRLFCYACSCKGLSERGVLSLGAIKERFLYCLLGAVLCAAVAVWFVFSATWHVAALFAAAAAVLTLVTVRMSASYRSARLILENPILNVGMASVSETMGGTAENTVNVVVSGFGILMDGKPYKFGHGGVNLTATAIDRESITLAFGDAEKAYSVRLLHGIADKAEVDKLTERLRYETGVVANVSGW